jgi:hypothetical protein
MSDDGHNGIGWAVKQMMMGYCVRRRGWNAPNLWIAISNIAGPRRIPAEQFWSAAARKFAEHQPDGKATVLPCIIMKVATGEILMGWLASQTDLLSFDWELVEDVKSAGE